MLIFQFDNVYSGQGVLFLSIRSVCFLLDNKKNVDTVDEMKQHCFVLSNISLADATH